MTLLQILDEEIREQAQQLERAKEIVSEYEGNGAFLRHTLAEVKWAILGEHPDLGVADVTIAIDIATRPPKK